MIKRTLLLTTLLALPALGYIEALTSLKGVLQESDVIARGVIDAVSQEKKVVILRITKSIKGKSAYERIRIDMGAGDAWHPEAALRHATVGTPVAVFYHKVENSDKAAVALVYANRFFMTCLGGDEVWRFSKIELAMNRVFHGTADELNELVFKILSGRTKPQAPNIQLRPYTKEILATLPPPPKEGEKWPEFDAAVAFKLEKTFTPDAEGFLQYWLLGGPIPEVEDFRWPVAPKEGDKVASVTLKAHQAAEYFVDLSAFASESGRDAAKSKFFGVTYLFCEQDLPGVRLAAGSDEGSRWELNGEAVATVQDVHALAKDQAFSKPLTLKKGRNILVMVVDNKANPAAACARFLDKDGKPVRGFINDSSPR
jgi:hypothetical protein